MFFSGAAAGAAAGAGAAGARNAAADRAARRRTGAGPTFEDILGGLGLDGSAAGADRWRPGSQAAPGRDRGPDRADPRGGVRRAPSAWSRSRASATRSRSRAGADTGSRVRLSGKGPDGLDVVVSVKVKAHPLYTRRGADLERELPVTLREALLGAEIPVATLKGRILLTIPAGTQAGRTFRLTGQGMPRLKGDGTGDLYLKIRVVLPTAMGDDARGAAQAFLDLVDQPDPRATTTSTTT